MKALAFIGSFALYIVLLVATIMVIHYMFNRVRSAFKSVFHR